MFQNIKVDIAYYKTNTDFEMEFNLCGCCRMRLLTDKAPDKKTLVHSLARAVSRSKVIIIVGNLFGADGIINIAASAMGGKLAKADNKAYGISSEDEIDIISGSTPLVTPEGYFGGCIIEKGPQTMIMLTENKNVRKAVMKNLIHPYIEELCALELKEKASAVTTDTPAPKHEMTEAEEIPPEIPVAEVEIPAEETAEAVADEVTIESEEEQTLTESDAEPEISEEQPVADQEEDFDFIFQDESEDIAEVNTEIGNEGESYTFLTDEEESDEGEIEDMELVTDTEGYEEIMMETPDSEEFATFDDEELDVNSDLLYDENIITHKEIKRRNADYYKDQEDFDGLVADDEEEYENGSFIKGDFGLPILILAIVLLVVLIVLCYCIFYVPSTQGVSASAYIKETFNTLFG